MRDLVQVSLARLWRDRRGVSALEYGILGAIMAIALLAAFGDPLSGAITVFFAGVFDTARTAATR